MNDHRAIDYQAILVIIEHIRGLGNPKRSPRRFRDMRGYFTILKDLGIRSCMTINLR